MLRIVHEHMQTWMRSFGRLSREAGWGGETRGQGGRPGAVTVLCVIYFLHEHLKQVGEMSG